MLSVLGMAFARECGSFEGEAGDGADRDFIIHLLKTFINAENLESKMMLWQVIIHVTFVASAIALVLIDPMSRRPQQRNQD